MSDFSKFTAAYLRPGADAHNHHLAFMQVVMGRIGAVGIEGVVRELNTSGHAFRETPSQSEGWRIFREALLDHDLQISYEAATNDIIFTTPKSDAARQAELESRAAQLDADGRMREQFYDIGFALSMSHCDRHETLSASQQVIYLIYELHSEMQASGLSLYFFNTGGQRVPQILNCLGEIGARSTRDLVERAATLVGAPFGDDLSPEQHETMDRCSEGLAALDDEYATLSEDLALMTMRCIGDR